MRGPRRRRRGRMQVCAGTGELVLGGGVPKRAGAPALLRLEGGDFDVVPADALADLVVLGFAAFGEADGGFVADLYGEFVGLGVDGEDGALHAARAAVEGFAVIAAG